MLAKMWRENPLTLLVGMQIVAATLENSMEVLKIDLPYDPVIALLGIYPKDTEILILKGYTHSNVYFIAAYQQEPNYEKSSVKRAQVPIN